MKLKVGDIVSIIAGKDKGKSGKILKINREKNTVTVEKINIRIKHHKKSSNGPGQRVESEAPLHASNVMILCPKTNKPSRIGYRVLTTGKKERYAKVSQEPLP